MSGSRGKRWGKNVGGLSEENHKSALSPMLHAIRTLDPIECTDLYGLQLLVSLECLSLYFPRDVQSVNANSLKTQEHLQIFPQDLEKHKFTSWPKNSMCRTKVGPSWVLLCSGGGACISSMTAALQHIAGVAWHGMGHGFIRQLLKLKRQHDHVRCWDCCCAPGCVCLSPQPEQTRHDKVPV